LSKPTNSLSLAKPGYVVQSKASGAVGTAKPEWPIRPKGRTRVVGQGCLQLIIEGSWCCFFLWRSHLLFTVFFVIKRLDDFELSTGRSCARGLRKIKED
jgi:hypothetical protein